MTATDRNLNSREIGKILTAKTNLLLNRTLMLTAYPVSEFNLAIVREAQSAVSFWTDEYERALRAEGHLDA